MTLAGNRPVFYAENQPLAARILFNAGIMVYNSGEC